MKDLNRIAAGINDSVPERARKVFSMYLTIEAVEKLRQVAEKHQISMSALMDSLLKEVVEDE